MQRLRFLIFDFSMEDLAKVIFKRKNRLYVPAFGTGRIIVQESELRDIKKAELFLMQKPTDEEAEVAQTAECGFSKRMSNKSFGRMGLLRRGADKRAGFSINVKEGERSKGSGTVLMNAGARYSSETEIEIISGTILDDVKDENNEENIEKRKNFYRQFKMLSPDGMKVTSYVDNPYLREIPFTKNTGAEEMWNSSNRHILQ